MFAATAATLDRWACRKAAHDRFSAERAALDLLTLAGRPAADERVPTPSRPGAARRHPGCREDRDHAIG